MTGLSVTAGGDSLAPVLSGSGGHVVWVSRAANLSIQDANGSVRDVFVRDLQARTTTLVSVNMNGISGNGPSESPSISADGRWVAFASRASDLVVGDTNSVSDVFLRDLTAGVTVCVSRREGGVFGNRESGSPWLSPEGRYVAFESRAANLPGGDSLGYVKAYLFDRVTGQLRRLDVPSAEVEIASRVAADIRDLRVSDDGSTVVFASLARNLARGPIRGAVELSSGVLIGRPAGSGLRALDWFQPQVPANVPATPIGFSLSADGRYLGVRVAPVSQQILSSSQFWVDLELGVVRPIATNLFTGHGVDTLGPVLSADGQRMIFGAREAGRAPAVYRWEAATGVATRVSGEVGERSVNVTNAVGRFLGASRDGGFVAFLGSLPGDSGTGAAREQLLVRRLETGELRRVPGTAGARVTADAGVPAVSFSDDGRRLAFQSADAGWVDRDRNEAHDVFVYDWETDAVMLVSGVSAERGVGWAGPGSSGAVAGALSAGGRRMVFHSAAPVWEAGDTNRALDVLVYDFDANAFHAVSVDVAGSGVGNAESHSGVISADGRWVAFSSRAGNLVIGDRNGLADVFLRDLQTFSTVLVSRRPDGTAAVRGAAGFALSADARFVAFESTSPDLVPAVPSANLNLYLFERETGAVSILTTNTAGGASTGSGQTPIFSPDGRWLVFESRATSLVRNAPVSGRGVYVRDLSTGVTRLAAVSTGASAASEIPAQEPMAAMAPDSSGMVFTHRPITGRSMLWYEFATGQLQVVAGDTRLGGVGAGGERVVYRTVSSAAGTSSEVRMLERSTGLIRTIASAGPGTLGTVTLSRDGRHVVFTSPVNGLAGGDTNGWNDVFLWDGQEGTTVLLSVGWHGRVAEAPSGAAQISGDGRTIAFTSFASDLVDGDFNGQADVFVVRLPGVESGFRVTTVTRVMTGEVRLVWPAKVGSRYRVEYAGDPAGVWQDLGVTVETPAEGQVTAIDREAAGLPRRFYRVVELP
jgi:Tol biopolymer transport system component